MDGVLVDFDKGYSKLVGGKSLKANSLENGEQSARDRFLQAGPQFWADLEWIDGGKEVLDTAQRLFTNVWILSSAGTTNEKLGQSVIKGKQEWLSKHIPSIPLSNVLIVYGKHRKKEYASRSRILVDDLPDTIASWTENHGIGILHSHTNYKKSIETLNGLANYL